MRSLAAILFVVLCLVPSRSLPAPAPSAFASPDGLDAAHHTQVKLLLAAGRARPGETVLAGVELKMEAGWHTYWKNPGEAGSATKIEWKLPPGVSAGDIQWPLPQKLPPAEVTTYGYEEEAVLIVPLTLGTNLAPGELELSAHVSWLECKDVCIPADAVVRAKLDIGGAAKPSADAALIKLWQSRVPQSGGLPSLQTEWRGVASNDTRNLVLQWTGKPVGADFYPDASDNMEIQTADEKVSSRSGMVLLPVSVKRISGDWPGKISGVVVTGVGDARQGHTVEVPIVLQPAAVVPGNATQSNPASAMFSATALGGAFPPLGLLLAQIFAALAGGVIMNLMPCVLPILSLKILSLVQLHGKGATEGRKHSLLYLFGVLVSFWFIAGMVIVGSIGSWGQQFQDARFVVIITVLMTLIALNLFGVFEFVLPGKAVGSAAELASREGNAGAFFNGVLAVVLGASCVAPLMATAIGWAITQSPLVIVLVFTAIGAGLALPYVLLTFFPPLQKLLPRPGAWMEKLKIALGFPMLGMAAWTLSLVVVHHGRRGVLWVGVFLVALGLASWVFGEFVQRGSRRRSLAWVVVIVTLGAAYGYALEYELDWRHPVFNASSPGVVEKDAGGIEWLPWSADAVAQARAAGRPVLVDFTADWCLTCQVNKKTSIEIESVRQKLKALNVVTLVGDYTLKNPLITAELKRFERAGVPLVMVYPKDPQAQPIVLPTLLTPGAVLSALDRAQ